MPISKTEIDLDGHTVETHRQNVTETRDGWIVKSSWTYYWIDKSLEDELDDGFLSEDLKNRDTWNNMTLRELVDEIPGVEKIETGVGGRKRAPDLLEVLSDRTLLLDGYDVDVRDATIASRARVPVRIAREGPPVIAAYLAAHGYDNSSIASALDKSEQTIAQYVSDVKAGRR